MRGLSIQPTHENCAEVVRGLRAAGIGAAPADAVPDVKVSSSANPTGFGAALAMIATLPLSDAEKAEAVRRLLEGTG